MNAGSIFTTLFNNSPFAIKMVKIAAPIFGQHLKLTLEDLEGKTYDDYGTDREQQLKKIMAFGAQLSECFEELEQVIIHLTIDKAKIDLLYEGRLHAEDYYKYHYDSFAIKLATILDLCGKLGITIFGLKISDRRANGGSFLKSPGINETAPGQRLQALAEFLQDFIQHRHQKVHQAKSEDNWFDRVVFWERFGELLKDDFFKSPTLDELTKEKIAETVTEIRHAIDNTAKLAIQFMDALEPQLDVLIAN